MYDDGKIVTLDKNTIRSNGRQDNRRGKELSASVNKYGYKQVTLSQNKKRKTYLVHRLVAEAFIPNYENKSTVNHINGNKLDNRVENLEWATNSEQKEHAIMMGLCNKNIEALCNANRRKAKRVIYNGKEYDSISAAEKENKVHRRVILRDGVII